MDFSTAGADQLQFTGTGIGQGINVNSNSTWLAAANGSRFYLAGIGTLQITVAPGVTFTNGLGLSGAAGGQDVYQLLGGGTLYQNSAATPAPASRPRSR